MGRPLRPLSTRINNRGPPRITDVPALPPDFDVPAPPMAPPPLGPMVTRAPYPFDLPPSNIFYRPVTNPPWHRRRPTKRPNPDIPPYRPLASMANPDAFSFTSEKPMEDILTLDLGSQFPHSNADQSALGAPSGEELEPPGNDTQETTTTVVEQLDLAFERNKEKNPKPEKSTKVTLVTPTMQTGLSILETPISLVTEESSRVEDPATIAPSAVSQTIIPTLSVEASNASSVSILAPPLEASIEEVGTTATQTMATQQLPSTSTSSVLNASSAASASSDLPYQPYRPRPGIVLDDTEFKPGGSRQPIITRPPLSAIGDIFDVTVSAVQGPGEPSAAQGRPYVIPVDLDNPNGQSDVITTPVGSDGFVSIDGKRTYLNLFGDNPEPTSVAALGVKPSAPSKNQVVQGTSYVEPDKAKPNYGSVKPAQRRPSFGRPKPSQPPHEICRTESGVSACHCRPGTARRKHRDPCRKIVSVLLSLRVDRIYERRIVWANELLEKSSESYEQLAYEAERALESAMSMTPFSDEYLGASVNNIYQGDRAQGQAGVFVNVTLQLEENADTARPSVRGDIQKHLLGVIQRRSNNVGNSALWVDSPPGSVSSLQDLDECSSPELHDCHLQADCINTFGSFKCQCRAGFRDPWPDNKHRAGRHCEQCSPAHCNNRGECRYQNGLEVCTCTGNYYGSQCELDGEVLGVAIGASVAAIIIIGLTLVCLVMWSRKWSREQKAAVGSPVFGYMATAGNTVKTPVVGAPPYQLTLEDRLRWAQIADVMAQANHYAVSFRGCLANFDIICKNMPNKA
ncbi:hypothetical protein HUJ05_007190 [Dendroctonus ponderosae]|nr:hypothetical protein HUJ05_007190 [Dendroctonus ponderosae]